MNSRDQALISSLMMDCNKMDVKGRGGGSHMHVFCSAEALTSRWWRRGGEGTRFLFNFTHSSNARARTDTHTNTLTYTPKLRSWKKIFKVIPVALSTLDNSVC